MTASIVLIGPGKAGKTTLSKLLGAALGMPAIDLDELRWNYYAEIGYDEKQAQAAARSGGLKALRAYWKPFQVHAIERVLADYPVDTVIAFGAWHTTFDDAADLEQAQSALADFPHVIHVLPAPDFDATYALLTERHRQATPHLSTEEFDAIMAELREYMHHPSNSRLATRTIYTAGKSPAESCAELVRLIRG